ncbi:MAG TPA: exodeoxyribonuclease VII large subunit, partial [Paracoccaceae bacterium]|nr:exodeoxyribonuclease VII large subunit [Paracoccaceae bacterium]
YKNTLQRGYTVVRGGGKVLTDKAQAVGLEVLEIEFRDGRLSIGAGSAPPETQPEPAAPAKPGKKPKKTKPPEQGSLF